MKFLKFLKNLKFNGGEVGSNPRTSCPVAGFQDQCFQPLSHLSNSKQHYLLLSKQLNNNN